MTHIIMAIDECGTEIMVGSFDNEWQASRHIDIAREQYVEYRSFWVEELRNAEYWSNRDDLDEFGCDLTEYH